MHIPEKAFSALTDEQKRRVEAARTPEELLAIAKESGYELTKEELNKVSGGGTGCPLCIHDNCPKKEVESSSW
jgi:predicted ribosomally synthesized peptide with nif11-like leader